MNKFKGIVFAVDFDGTCVFHQYPRVGGEIPGAADTLRWIISEGGKVILHTMRSNMRGSDYLSNALQWFIEREITLYGINSNPDQLTWTSSPKVYAHYYIDDRALGTPVNYDNETGTFYLDWRNMRRILEAIAPEAEPLHVSQ